MSGHRVLQLFVPADAEATIPAACRGTVLAGVVEETNMAAPASTLSRILIIVLLAVTAAGCELIGDIFQAGMWVGAIGIILVVVLVVFAVGKFRG